MERVWKEKFLNEEGKPDNGSPQKEEIFFDNIAKQIRTVVEHFRSDNNNISARANHAKVLAGFTKAVFKIADDIPKDLQAGFLIPGKEYNAIVRFSNANGIIVDDDSKPDLRGVAIRINTTENSSHDLLMTNAELHHAKDAREAMAAFMAGVEKDIIENKIPDNFPLEDEIAGLIGALPYLIKQVGFKTALYIAGTLKKQMNLKVLSLSTETFWSRSPLAIGNITSDSSVAVKYRLRPFLEKPSQDDIEEGEKDLTQKIENELKDNDVRYYLEVQRFKNEELTPIEDARISWGDDSSFEKIAELIIPKDSINEKEKVDKISFSPWNVNQKNFKPLGSMNRSRKKVYEASAAFRN